jgi:N-acetyl-anhydromuramyl-L-alanine amidase AmpD
MTRVLTRVEVRATATASAKQKRPSLADQVVQAMEILLLAFFYARPGAVLLLDEPDAHLRDVYALVRRVASDRGAQLVISTHSEVILDETDPSRIAPLGGIQTDEEKQRIVLHFTAGYLKGDIDTLTKSENHVSVPFVIARDGTIYNLWPSKYWSYHLGKGAQGGNTAMSGRSVAIELSNIGYLMKKGSSLVTAYSSTDVYCSEDETSYYKKVPAYREREYFATFTKQQCASLVKLLRYLTAKYNIPRQFVEVAKRYDVLASVDQFRGITSHVNYRPSGKWDIGACFAWDTVVAGVQAA